MALDSTNIRLDARHVSDKDCRDTDRPSVRVRDAFFDEAHIERTAEICVRSLSDYIDDPLTVFGNIAIRSSISCTLTQSGLFPFASDLRIFIPFSSMTVVQLQVVRSISYSLQATASIRYKHLDGTLSLCCPRDTDKVFVDAALVLFAINVLILRAVAGQSMNASTIINVTQQRVLASIHVHRSQLARADSLTRAYVAARATDES